MIPALLAPTVRAKNMRRGNLSLDVVEAKCANPGRSKDSGCYLPAKYSKTRRLKQFFVERYWLTLDADYAREGDFLADFRDAFGTHEYLVHSTYSSTPESPRYRVILPLASPADADSYRATAREAMEKVGVKYFDPTCDDPYRVMHLPAAPQGPVWYERSQGVLLEVTRPARAADVAVANVKNPFDLPGIVGAFNRAYRGDFPRLVASYDLPYTPEDGRWRYTPAKSQPGFSEVADGVFYSFHSNDPAQGRALSAFDLVAVHRYGSLDAGVDNRTPPHKLPSVIKFKEDALQDKDAVAEYARQALGADNIEADASKDLATILSARDKDGKVKATSEVWKALTRLDPVLKGFRYNELTSSFEVPESAPWASYEHQLGQRDLSALMVYLEDTWGLQVTSDRLMSLLEALSFKMSYHPVREYLEALPAWDGVERVAECLPGVVPDAHSRMAARKALVAAVARVYEPGCKWDHVLVLQGKEGLGKTVFIESLFKGFDTELTSITSKDDILRAHRGWVAVADEGAILEEKNFSRLKSFLSQRHDTVRAPYARAAEDKQRGFVVWATTNKETPLSRGEGNRRFLVVKATEKADFNKILDPEYIGMLWAEALHIYRESAEDLYLSTPEYELNRESQASFTEEDPYSGVVDAYLDSKVPAGWAYMEPAQRVQWKYNRSQGLEAEGTELVKEVSVASIWVEALEGKLTQLTAKESERLDSVLGTISRLERVPEPQEQPGYGRQVIYKVKE